jgi:nucleoid DNA-binding protein
MVKTDDTRTGEGQSGHLAAESAYARLPAEIRKQIDSLAEDPGMKRLPDIRERLAANWEGKYELFESQVRLLEMAELPGLEAGDPRGFLAITYSGSILSVGPLAPLGRWIEYVPIQLRRDVPDIVSGEAAQIDGAVARDSSLLFLKGPLKSTSSVYRIAACAEGIEPEEQDRRIREAAIFLTHGFMKMNRSLSEAPAGGASDRASAEQFTLKGMSQYLARKNGLAAVLVKRLLDDFFATAESGLMLGERVSLGRLGSLSLKVKPARKARILKNPITKEDILVPAKGETPTPKMSFHKELKEKAAGLPPSRL